jgi:hypothetical protein
MGDTFVKVNTFLFRKSVETLRDQIRFHDRYMNFLKHRLYIRETKGQFLLNTVSLNI